MRNRAAASVALLSGLLCPILALAIGSEVRTGIFAGPVVGLKYQTPHSSGMTGPRGEFQYRDGDVVVFAVGDVVLGYAKGAERVNTAQLVSRVSGDINKLSDPLVTNLARLLQSLDRDGLVENGVTIAPQVHTLIGSQVINFAQSEQAFTRDAVVTGLLERLSRTSGVFSAMNPRQLPSAAVARNQMRRDIRGIVKMTDVKVPLRDGSFLYADVFRRADGGRYPPIMNLGVYGKSFVNECICSPADALRKEEMEDRYFSGNPDGYMFENHESVNTNVWVPDGYVVVRVDGRGTCNSPGTIDPLSKKEAEDLYDAIEWAAGQPWSNGNVGLWGMSYYAMNQYNVAVLRPPHLKALVPIATDAVSYDEVLYNGGLLNEEFINMWWDHTKHAVCGELRAKDFIGIARAHPFNDPAIYGPQGGIFVSPAMSKVALPQWVTMPTTHDGHIHQLGSSESYINSASKDKKLTITEDWFLNAYADPAEHMAFFDHWLKGKANGVMNGPRVRMAVRTGNGGYYTQEASDWPVPETRYTRVYLDASPSAWEGDGRRQDFMRLTASVPAVERNANYSAQVDVGSIWPRKVGSAACWASGVSFVTDPMPEDTVLAGYMKLGLWVSSTSTDMDIYASVRVMDDQNREVDYSGRPDLKDPTNVYPIGIGWLKVSHRKIDIKRSTEYRPKHTHQQTDYAPLKKDEIVPIEVEVWPDVELVKKGYRLRLDLQPHDGCGHGTRHSYDSSYHTGAENTIYTGPKHPSYLQVPVIARE